MSIEARAHAPLSPPPARARRGLAPLGAKSAFSWPVIAIYVPFGVIAQVSPNVGAFGGSTGRWLLASAISMCVLAGSLLAARSLVCRQSPPRPLVVVGAYAGTALAQSLTFGIAAVLLGATEEFHLGFRLTGVIVHVTMLIGVGLAVARHDAHHRIVTDLQRSRTRLLALGDSLETELDRLQAELSGAVRASLGPALEALDEALTRTAAGDDTTAALEAMEDLVEQRVRPLSQELVKETPSFEDQGATTPPARVPLPARFRLANGIWPGTAALALTIMSVASAARILTTANLVLYLAMVGACIWAGLTLVQHVLGTREARTPVGVAALIAIHALVALLTYALIAGTGMTMPAGLQIPAIAAGGLVGALTAGAVLVDARRAISESELAAVTDRLQHAVTLVRRRQHLFRRRLAFVLHGSLQGALYAAALRLRETATPDKTTIERIRSDVLAALAQLEPNQPGGEPQLQTTLDALVTGWDAGRRVTVHMEPAVENVLASDPDADAATAEVVREAVNNAFRHGAARAVEVDLIVNDGHGEATARDIVVVVHDDGTGVPGNVRPGLGSTLFDELCRSWTWERDQQGTTFRALIAGD